MGNTKGVITLKAEIAYNPIAMRGEMVSDQ